MTIPAVSQLACRLALLLAIALLFGCGKSSRQESLERPVSKTPPPTIAELETLLQSELAKLGKSASRTTSEAPSGNEDRVFDLQAIPLELAAPVTATAPEGVLLQWTEKLVGDYDENGLVTVADITPLANPDYWQMALSYVDPRSEDANWPSPDGTLPALTFDPVWRLARVDGESNGLITLGDISPIAKHFGEGISGYRVYRKTVGDADYEQLPGDVFLSITPAASQGKVSIPRAAADAPEGVGPDLTFGVHYTLLDQTLPAAGDYEYVVAPYDLTSDAEGPQSFSFTVSYPADPQLPVDPGTDPPTVTLTTVGAASGDAPFNVFFTASPVSPTTQISSMQWDFDSDGTIDASTGRHPVVQHSYPTPGHYKATVYAVEPGGRSASDQTDIDVLDNGNSLPVAALSASPTSGPASLDVTLDASASTDVEGIVRYEWDVLGTGTFISGVDPTFQANYPEGEYEALVRITDTDDAQATATVHISVGPTDSLPPTLSITNDVVAGTYAPEDVQITFTVDDPEDAQMTLDVDWENDGTLDASFPVTDGDVVQSHMYPNFGSSSLRARLTDDHALTDEDTSTFTLLENHPPVAQLLADNDTGTSPFTVNFDASGSTDPDAGQTLSYYWDFTGTGNFNGPFTAQESFTYYEFGLRGAWVRVMDDNGAFDDAEVDITTTTGWEYDIPVPKYTGPSFVNPEISLAIVNGNPAIAYMRDSTLFYARADDALGTQWSTATLLDADPDIPMEPSLKVIGGVPAVAYLTAAGGLFYATAQDANGSGWNPRVQINLFSGSGSATDLESVNGNPAIAWIDSLGQLYYVRATSADGTAWGLPHYFAQLNSLNPFSQEIDLDIVGGNPAIAAGSTDTLLYWRAMDADGTLWGSSHTAYSGSDVKQSVAMVVPIGLPLGLPTLVFYRDDGIYSVRAADVDGLLWGAPVQVASLDVSGWNLEMPEIEAEIANSVVCTLDLNQRFFASTDAFGTTWGPKSGIFDPPGAGNLDSYDIAEAGGMPLVAIEGPMGIVIARLH